MINSLQYFQLSTGSFSQSITKIWQMGLIISLLIVTIEYVYFRISLNRTLSEPYLKETKLLKEHSLPLKIKITSHNISPFITGIFSNILVLPNYTSYIKDQRDLVYIFHHEMTHIKKKDILFKTMYLFARCIHWFNPLVYLMGNKFTIDTEMACDEVVTETLNNNEKIEYCNILLKYSTYNNPINSMYNSALSHSGIKIKDRFNAVLNPTKKEGKIIVGIAYILLFIVLIIAVTDFSVGDTKITDINPYHAAAEFPQVQANEIEITITYEKVNNIYTKTAIIKNLAIK